MTTKDYSIFKTVEGNREISPTHVANLADAIERRNLLEYYPILVNERMEVIDGQHRLLAAASKGYDVHYEIVKGLQLEDVMSINTASKSWGINDFVDCYIKLGKTSYQQLRDFSKQYGMSITLAATLLGGRMAFEGGGDIEAIRAGRFKVQSPEFAERIAQLSMSLAPYADFPVKRDRLFIGALVALDNNIQFDSGRLLAKLRMHGLKIERRPSIKYYLLHIEELYNANSKQAGKVELYVSSQAAA